MSENYENQTRTTGLRRQIGTRQMSILSRSFLIAGLGFVAIALFGWLICYLLTQTNTFNSSSLNILYLVSIILIVVSSFMSFFAWRKIYNIKKTTIFLMYLFYVLGQGFGFGILFTAFYINFPGTKGISYLIFIFAIAGFAFLIASLIGTRLSLKGTMSLGKFVTWLSIAFLFLFFVMMILSLVANFTGSFSQAIDTWMLFVMSIACLLFFLYTIYDVSLISKSQAFIESQENKVQMNFALMFGFMLLVDLIGLVYTIAYYFLRFAR